MIWIATVNEAIHREFEELGLTEVRNEHFGCEYWDGSMMLLRYNDRREERAPVSLTLKNCIKRIPGEEWIMVNTETGEVDGKLELETTELEMVINVEGELMIRERK